jgi:hypothetical protein
MTLTTGSRLRDATQVGSGRSKLGLAAHPGIPCRLSIAQSDVLVVAACRQRSSALTVLELPAKLRGCMRRPHVPRGMSEVRPAERVRHKHNYLYLDTHLALAYFEETLPISVLLPFDYRRHKRDLRGR